MIYLDSSALLKLLVEERESTALVAWLSDSSPLLVVSSELAKVEVVRAARRLDPLAIPAARALLSQLDLIPLRSDLIEDAGERGDPTLRSLDAIHLSSAVSIREELSAFVAYDHRLLAAAAAADLPIESPGVVA